MDVFRYSLTLKPNAVFTDEEAVREVLTAGGLQPSPGEVDVALRELAKAVSTADGMRSVVGDDFEITVQRLEDGGLIPIAGAVCAPVEEEA